MWVQKKLSELAGGDEFKYELDSNDIFYKLETNKLYTPHPGICYTVKKNEFVLYRCHMSPELVTVYIEAPKIKMRDVKPGQCFQFATDINYKHCHTYLMTEHQSKTVTVKHPSPKGIGKLIEWMPNFLNEEVQLVEWGG